LHTLLVKLFCKAYNHSPPFLQSVISCAGHSSTHDPPALTPAKRQELSLAEPQSAPEWSTSASGRQRKGQGETTHRCATNSTYKSDATDHRTLYTSSEGWYKAVNVLTGSDAISLLVALTCRCLMQYPTSLNTIKQADELC
jgi:hypothetical protein